MSIQPTPADAKAVAEAKLIFVNGLGFEGWMTGLIKASGVKAAIAVAVARCDPLQVGDDDHDHGGTKHDARQFTSRSSRLAERGQCEGLCRQHPRRPVAADPAGQPPIEANATAYLAQLDALEGEVRAAIARIPAGRASAHHLA